MKTGVLASILAVVAYIVPFIAAYNPALLLEGTPVMIVQSTITAFVGVYLIAAAIQGYFMGHLNLLKRLIVACAAMGFMIVGTFTDVIGLIILVAFVVYQKFIANKKEPNIPANA